MSMFYKFDVISMIYKCDKINGFNYKIFYIKYTPESICFVFERETTSQRERQKKIERERESTSGFPMHGENTIISNLMNTYFNKEK